MRHVIIHGRRERRRSGKAFTVMAVGSAIGGNGDPNDGATQYEDGDIQFYWWGLR